MSDRAVRVRMAPSPTGHPHVGLVRTALFNWAFARKNQGTFVLRIEDTDAARNTEESYSDILDLFAWLGLDWDEGPDVGGEYGPYRQSERGNVYTEVLNKLLEADHAYLCYCSNEEIVARRAESGSKDRGYDGYCRHLTADQIAAFEAEARKPVTRLRMPVEPIVWDDVIRGPVSFDPAHVPDPVLAKGNGEVLYTLVNPVDDAMMDISHVFRGEDMLPSTPRQIPLYHALAAVGVGQGPPIFGHLPYVMGKGNKKLSKRDPEANALLYREAGFIPAGMMNYLALLGWGFSADRDVFTVDEFVQAFDINNVNPNPARFDLKKAEAINAAHMRLLTHEDLACYSYPFLEAAGLVGPVPHRGQVELIRRAMPLVSTRVANLAEVPGMVSSLLVSESGFSIEGDQAGKVFNEVGLATLARSLEVLAPLAPWTSTAIQSALSHALVEEDGLKPRVAYGALRLATSGARISPPLFECMELLGRVRTLSRIEAALKSYSV